MFAIPIYVYFIPVLLTPLPLLIINFDMRTRYKHQWHSLSKLIHGRELSCLDIAFRSQGRSFGHADIKQSNDVRGPFRFCSPSFISNSNSGVISMFGWYCTIFLIATCLLVESSFSDLNHIHFPHIG